MKKKMVEKTMETAMNAGVVGVGAESKSEGAFSGSTPRSIAMSASLSWGKACMYHKLEKQWV